MRTWTQILFVPESAVMGKSMARRHTPSRLSGCSMKCCHRSADAFANLVHPFTYEYVGAKASPSRHLHGCLMERSFP